MVSYRCGRCWRAIPEKLLEAHAENSHGVAAVEIDFSPLKEVTDERP